jgi:serine/threonine-protein kinase
MMTDRVIFINLQSRSLNFWQAFLAVCIKKDRFPDFRFTQVFQLTIIINRLPFVISIKKGFQMTDMIGKSIGEYQLLELIGEDEHTLQIKAFQPGKERYVNFTMLKPHAAKNDLFVQQFLNSAQIASKMTHANILPVYDYGRQEEIIYRISALVASGAVADHRSKFHELQNANMLISQITDGLTYIYARGNIHGNLKSSNIYLDPELRPLLAGFAITQLPGNAENPYRSPEQVQGGVVDQRTDVYALGVLLYEVLTGMTPPVGIVVKPSSNRSDIPEAIDQVVLKAMAQSPEQRFQSPAEFSNALKNAVVSPVSTPTQVQPAPTPPPAVSQSVSVQQAKGTNWTAIILGVVLVAVLIGAAALIIPRLMGDDDMVDDPTVPTVEQPTAPPIEEPTDPPATQPPIEEPTDPPEDGPGFELPEGLPDFCYSIGFAAGLAAFGMTIAFRKQKRDTFHSDKD